MAREAMVGAEADASGLSPLAPFNQPVRHTKTEYTCTAHCELFIGVRVLKDASPETTLKSEYAIKLRFRRLYVSEFRRELSDADFRVWTETAARAKAAEGTDVAIAVAGVPPILAAQLRESNVVAP